MTGVDISQYDDLTVRDAAQKIKYTDVKKILPEIAAAVSTDKATQKRILDEFKRLQETESNPGRTISERIVELLRAEDQLGKTETRSQESDFDIEPGSFTIDTDQKVRSEQQVNSHNQDWNETAKELRGLFDKTNFDKDWVQWSPGHLDPNSPKAKE